MGRTGPGLATGPSGKTVLVQTQQLSGSFLIKAASNVEEHGAELFISFHHPSEFWPSNADTQNAALWGRGGGGGASTQTQAVKKAAALWAIIPEVISPL